MPYRIAGIDVHKRMLAVVVADVEVEGTSGEFERRQVGTSPDQLRALAEWFVEREVEEVVMESTAQYWRPVWEALERDWQPPQRQRPSAGPAHRRVASRAGAVESRAARPEERFSGCRTVGEAVGRARAHAQLCAGVTQRLWRTVTRRKYQLDAQSGAAAEPARVPARGSAHQGVESGVRSARAQCATHAARRRDGETDPATVAALGSPRLHATPDQLRDALGACADLHPVYRRLLAMTLDELRVIEAHIGNSMRNWRGCSACIRTPWSDWRPCPAWASIRRSRSSPKSGRRPRRFPPPSASPRGWAPVRAR